MRVNSRGRFEFRNRSQAYNSDMNSPTVRYFPLQAGDGPTNMALDEAMLLATEQGLASFRFYTWSEATLSLGYFQPAELRLSDPRLASLPWVRRSSGGAAILHHHELTYCLALPSGSEWRSQESWVCRFHHLVVKAL